MTGWTSLAAPGDEKLLEPSIKQMAAARTGFIDALHADRSPLARKAGSFVRAKTFANPTARLAVNKA